MLFDRVSDKPVAECATDNTGWQCQADRPILCDLHSAAFGESHAGFNKRPPGELLTCQVISHGSATAGPAWEP